MIAAFFQLLFESIATVIDRKYGLLAVWVFGIFFITTLIAVTRFLIN